MKKIVSIALAIALICFMIASTAFANETAVLKVETTTTSCLLYTSPSPRDS